MWTEPTECGGEVQAIHAAELSLTGPHAFIIQLESIEHLGLNYSLTST